MCFADGTLVHTKNGTVRVEDIRTGGYVLAQPEEQGEQTYKRVLMKTCLEDTPVWMVIYNVGDWGSQNYHRLVITPNQPLWVDGKGWVQVKDMDFDGDELQLANGEVAKLMQVSPLYFSATVGVA